MDARHFDTLVRTLTEAGPRRRVLGLLATLPVLGGLGALFAADTAEAKDRRRRRKDRHQRRKNPGGRKQGCKPKSKTTVCAGQCGPVKNRQTCGKTVDCGSCACTPACTPCQTCDTATQTCVDRCPAASCCNAACVDLQTDDANCGTCGNTCAEGQTCQGGVCGVACGSDFCPAATEICVDDACVVCDVCATCSETTVQGAINAAASGDTIAICAGTYVRQGDNQLARIEGKDLTLVGAGTGAGGTTLDGGGISPAEALVVIFQATAELKNLTVTGSNDEPAVVGAGSSLVTLTGVLVTGNRANQAGGGIFNNDRVVLNAGTEVTGNSASTGGGISNNGVDSLLTLNAGSRVVDNMATNTAPGILNVGTVIAQPGSEVEGCVNVGSATGCPA